MRQQHEQAVDEDPEPDTDREDGERVHQQDTGDGAAGREEEDPAARSTPWCA